MIYVSEQINMSLGVTVSINLYEHNKTAYRFAMSMLNKCWKATVIHPAGTKVCSGTVLKKIMLMIFFDSEQWNKQQNTVKTSSGPKFHKRSGILI